MKIQTQTISSTDLYDGVLTPINIVFADPDYSAATKETLVKTQIAITNLFNVTTPQEISNIQKNVPIEDIILSVRGQGFANDSFPFTHLKGFCSTVFDNANEKTKLKAKKILDNIAEQIITYDAQ